MNDAMGGETNEHPVQVAGVIISTDTQPAGTPQATGAATGAKLFSVGDNTPINQQAKALTSQFIATQNNEDVRAINLSFGDLLRDSHVTDGNSLYTQFIDWSAREHNTLYVVGGTQLDNQGNPSVLPVPTDNFNGITTAASSKVGDVYRQVADFNDLSLDAVGDRTSVDIIAPGVGVLLASQGNINQTADGTSLAAPHVTGTVALLQEYGDFQVAAAAPNWTGVVSSIPSPRRHEVMKAVLMNSADKIEDTSGTGKYLGMDRTVLKKLKTGQTAGQEDDWFDSPAYSTYPPLTAATEIPLDEEMGAGHLNAKRALQQFIPGEQEVNGHFGSPPVGDVPVIGWDYGTIAGTNWPINKYALDETLVAGNFISITLAWDREVEFANDADMDDEYDIGDTFETYTDLDDVLTNLDLYLVPAGTFDVGDNDVGVSNSFVTPVEHIFTEIPFDGDYEIWVYRNEQFAQPQDYGIAWWYGLASDIDPPTLGDFDNDGDVDGADFLAWQRDPNVGNLTDWENNFGNSAAVAGAAAVPEPGTWVLLLMGVFLNLQVLRKKQQSNSW